MMTTFPWRIVTLIVMAVCAVTLIVWDILVASNRVSGDTISEVVLAFVRQYPIAGFALFFTLGVVVGHLLWPQIIHKE